MAKYKCLSKHYDCGKMYNRVFDDSYTWGAKILTVGNLAHNSFAKQFFELIKEDNSMKKQITLTLDKARLIYGKSPEMDELLLANFSKDELEKKALPKSWEKLPILQGYWINPSSNVTKTAIIKEPFIENSKSVFATKKQAKSALAMAQLSQLMAVYNDGWEPKWDVVEFCYCIIPFKNTIKITHYTLDRQFLAFKTAELRDEFLANFKPLIKEYFMID